METKTLNEERKASAFQDPLKNFYVVIRSVDSEEVDVFIEKFLAESEATQKYYNDPFWVKSAKAVLSAVLYYLMECEKVEEKDITLESAYKLLKSGIVDFVEGEDKSALDLLMENEKQVAKEEDRVSRAARYYQTFKLTTNKTARNILITLAEGLEAYMAKENQ